MKVSLGFSNYSFSSSLEYKLGKRCLGRFRMFYFVHVNNKHLHISFFVLEQIHNGILKLYNDFNNKLKFCFFLLVNYSDDILHLNTVGFLENFAPFPLPPVFGSVVPFGLRRVTCHTVVFVVRAVSVILNHA